MTLIFGSGSGATDSIVNGSFESSTNGWGAGATGFEGTASADYSHSGSYSGRVMYNGSDYESLRQDFAAVAHADVSSFGYWYRNSSYYTYIILYFSDSSSASYQIFGNADEWHYVDIMSIVTNPCTGDLLFPTDKSVTGIEFFVDGSYAGPLFIDEVSLISGIVLTEAISWDEAQSCDVAMRDIPLKDNGAHIDTGTYVLNPRVLNVTIRMTDAQRTEFLAYFALNTLMTFYANDGSGTWTYTGWFKDFPRIYEYSKKNSGEIRYWKCDLKFVIQSISYNGSAYGEDIDTIRINGVKYNTVIDFAIGLTNTLGNDEQYVNNSTVSIETDVWSKSATKLTYMIRVSSAGKYLLDQLIAAHAITTLEDDEYGYSNYIWLQDVNETWEGEINNAKPWKIELTLILLLDLGTY